MPLTSFTSCPCPLARRTPRRWRWLLLGVVAVITTPAFAAGPPQPCFVEPPFHLVRAFPKAKQNARNYLAFSPDGKHLATSGYEGVVLWDIASGRRIANNGFDGKVSGELAFSPDGREIHCLCGGRGALQTLDARTLRVLRGIPPLKEDSRFSGLTLSPDGRMAVLTTPEKKLGAWVVATGKQLWLREEPQIRPFLAFNPSGKEFAALMLEGPPQVFDAATGRRAFAPDMKGTRGPGSRAAALAFSGTTGLFAGADDRAPRVALWGDGGRYAGDIRWATRLAAEVLATRVVPAYAVGLTFSADGKSLAAKCRDGFFRLFEVEGGGQRAEWEPNGTITFSPDGRWLATLNTEHADLSLFDWRRASAKSRRGRPPEKARWWASLGSRDAALGFRTMTEMVASPNEALALLGREAIRDANAGGRAAALIPTLDDDDFETRRKAEDDLAKLGPSAEAVMRAALAKATSLQVRATLRRLLAKLEAGPSGPLRRLRLVEVLEHLGSPEARRLLDALAPHWPDADTARKRIRPRTGL